MPTIFLPAQVYFKEVPTILFDELPMQCVKCTPRSEDSGIQTTPLAEVSTRLYCGKLARIIAAHYLIPPTDMYEILTGGVTIVNSTNKVSKDGEAFMRTIVPTVIRDISTKRFGPRSLFRK